MRSLHNEAEPFDVRETDLPDVTQADPSVVYTVRPLGTEKFRELHRAHTKKVLNKRTGQREDDHDAEGFADAVCDFVLVGWVGVVDHGEPAPCTRENKMRLDGQVKTGLIAVAGLNRLDADDTARSFRPPA